MRWHGRTSQSHRPDARPHLHMRCGHRGSLLFVLCTEYSRKNADQRPSIARGGFPRSIDCESTAPGALQAYTQARVEPPPEAFSCTGLSAFKTRPENINTTRTIRVGLFLPCQQLCSATTPKNMSVLDSKHHAP